MQDLLKVILFTIIFLNVWTAKSFAETRARLFSSDAATTNSMSASTDDDHRKDHPSQEKRFEHKNDQSPTHQPPHPVASQAVLLSAPDKDHHKNDHAASNQSTSKHDKTTFVKDHGKAQDQKDKQHHDDRDRRDHDNHYTPPTYTYVSYTPYIGEILPMLPWDYSTIEVNDQTYYTSNGVYYMDNEQGYQVVPQPITVDNTADSNNTDESFTVNIPDGNGGYVPVVIRRSGTGSGYVGPQGEYYEDFPTVSQLQETYLN